MVNPGWKEADEGRTSVATSPNVSPPTIRSSKPEMSEDEPETVSAPVTKESEKEKVTDTKEGVSAPSPTSTASEFAAPEETTDVRNSNISLPPAALTNTEDETPFTYHDITTPTHKNTYGSSRRLSNEEIRRPHHLWKG